MEWDYSVRMFDVDGYDYPGNLESILNEAGADGWELVSTDHGRSIFKRQKLTVIALGAIE